ncbi:hypothetical protein [Campylobacter concisus]|uniref:hypothetical protein n=1 Tax=Campylobacter concisus TaxID=199 RepID=UPI0015E1A6C7|nr:hypothetical protein [Campylobacter concisus]MBS5827596.1 hypothetical protein [Campylobacter concisus]
MLAKIKNLSIYIGCFGVLKGEIKKLDLYRSHAPLLCSASRIITARNLAKFL